jgi:hypothetical protein
MPENQAAVRLNETWARAAAAVARHQRDFFIEAMRELQRRQGASLGSTQSDTRPPSERPARASE